jgi:hypothetical protein
MRSADEKTRASLNRERVELHERLFVERLLRGTKALDKPLRLALLSLERRRFTAVLRLTKLCSFTQQ